MKKYFVFNDDCEVPGVDFGIVEAESPEEAKEKYIANYVDNLDEDDDYFTCMAVNMCFSERFFFHNGKHCFNEYGKPRYSNAKLQKIMEENVRDFFEEKPGYADIYIKAFDGAIELPDEVFRYMAMRECSEDRYMKTRVVMLESITIKPG